MTPCLSVTRAHGLYDGVLIFEAPDVETAMNFVRQIGFETRYVTETSTAIPSQKA